MARSHPLITCPIPATNSNALSPKGPLDESIFLDCAEISGKSFKYNVYFAFTYNTVCRGIVRIYVEADTVAGCINTL